MKFKRRNVDLEKQVEIVLSNEYLMTLAREKIEQAESSYRTNHPHSLLPKRVLEIGGAGGVTKNLRPNWVVSDVREAPGVDVIADGMDLPFQNEEFDLVFGIDVLHHVTNVPRLLTEIHRVLKPNGVFFVREPYWGLPAQIIWRFFHPEDFSLKRLQKTPLDSNPMSGNQALAWGILRKNKYLAFDLDKKFSIIELEPENGISFLLSGGATFTTIFPRKILLKLHRMEKKYKTWLRIFGFSKSFYFSRPG